MGPQLGCADPVLTLGDSTPEVLLPPASSSHADRYSTTGPRPTSGETSSALLCSAPLCSAHPSEQPSGGTETKKRRRRRSKLGALPRRRSVFALTSRWDQRAYIMSMPPMPGLGVASSSSGSSTMRVSVVKIMPAMLAAFCRALLVTLVGSMIPLATMSTN